MIQPLGNFGALGLQRLIILTIKRNGGKSLKSKLKKYALKSGNSSQTKETSRLVK